MVSAGKYIPGRTPMVVALLFLAVIAGFAGCLLCGSVDIPASDVWGALTAGPVEKQTWRVIVVQTRIPMAITAATAGCALSVAGLMLQTCFNNPLAGPSILGISTGASLGVAVVMMASGAMVIGGGGYYATIMVGALAGAGVVLLTLVLLSRVVRSSTLLLIAGILIGYFSSSAISLLNYYSAADNVYSFTIWGLGSFSSSGLDRSVLFAAIAVPVAALSMLFVKPLNAMLLGERYAYSLGVEVRTMRLWLLVATGVLTAIVTAFCGPIGFVGLIVPHIARMSLRTSNHNRLLPVSALAGAAVALLCAWLSVGLASDGVIPINAITPVIGVPVILYVMLNGRKSY